MDPGPARRRLQLGLDSWRAAWAQSIRLRAPGLPGRIDSFLRRLRAGAGLHQAEEQIFFAIRDREAELTAQVADLQARLSRMEALLEEEHAGAWQERRERVWIRLLDQTTALRDCLSDSQVTTSDLARVFAWLEMADPSFAKAATVRLAVHSPERSCEALMGNGPGNLERSRSASVAGEPSALLYLVELFPSRSPWTESGRIATVLAAGGAAVVLMPLEAEIQVKDAELVCTGSMQLPLATSRPLRLMILQKPWLELHQMKAGFPLFVDATDPGPVTASIRAHESYEEAESAWLTGQLKPGFTFVDVGANIGYYSVLAARRVGPAGRVIAIEPDPLNAAILRRNAAKAATPPGVQVVECAVGAEPGTGTLYRSSTNFGDHRMYRTQRQDLNTTLSRPRIELEVRVETLDQLLAAQSRVDIIKSDTQGYEVEVVKGLSGTIEKFHPTLILEWWPYGLRQVGHDPAALVSLVKSHGYSCFTLDETLRPLLPGAPAFGFTSEDDYSTLVGLFRPGGASTP